MNADTWVYPIGRYQPPLNFTQDLIKQSISVIEALPSWLDVCIENLDESQLETAYRPEGWTIGQVIHHLADSHMNAYIRLKLTLTETNPTVKPYDEKLWAELPDNKLVPVNVSITLLHALHRRWIETLRSMTEDDWQRTYYHPELKEQVALWQMTAHYAWHSRHHMEQIRTLRKRRGW
ncbi:YfiT family bacillithiol transferase [Arcticibacter sp.]|uniref:YfiT family bacillithiol transferase n=1 Tax=Arcticibacter sp. TaxID=1872630 RepID=UPI00388EB584